MTQPINNRVNFIPRSNGVIERIEAKRNAVVIDYFDELRDDDGEMRRVVTIECKDQHMKEVLLQKAREILEKLNG